jgi:hypothetical protein
MLNAPDATSLLIVESGGLERYRSLFFLEILTR